MKIKIKEKSFLDVKNLPDEKRKKPSKQLLTLFVLIKSLIYNLVALF